MNSVRVKRAALLAVSALTIVAGGTVAHAQSRDPEAAREKWQRVPDLVAAMRITEGARVADVGAGGGFLTVRLAAAVGPSGRVYAVDIVAAVLQKLRDRVATAGLSNVEVVEATEDDPRLAPESVMRS
jgi:protein-L-isoaspartate O-methyltransferase